MRIELLAADDLERLAPLWLELHAHHQAVAPQLAPYVGDEASWRVRRSLYEHALAAGGFALVARVNGGDIGYALTAIEPAQWPATFDTGSDTAELLTLAVRPGLRGRGVGSALLDAVDARFGREGRDERAIGGGHLADGPRRRRDQTPRRRPRSTRRGPRLGAARCRRPAPGRRRRARPVDRRDRAERRRAPPLRAARLPARLAAADPLRAPALSGARAMSPRLGRRIARFNRVVTNRVLGPVAPRLPAFGIVVHAGRKSGREYRTPVNVFRSQGQYVIALTYGPGADWVRNVQAAGGCDLITRGRRHRLTAPQLVHDETRRRVPALVRLPLRFLDVADFLCFEQPGTGA
jgi:deazaflavin-dependent oxidoreductase (nitroreductase family)